MVKKVFVLLIVVFCVVITGSWALAATCPDVKGDWVMASHWVYYNESTDSFGYMDMDIILHITNQNGCLFYGNGEIPSDPDSGCPLTGVVGSNNTITITSCDTIINGTLTGLSKKIYGTIDGTCSNLDVKGDDTFFGTCYAIGTRQ
jgi:hypothetical protein